MKAQFLLQVIFLLKGVGTVCRELLFNILEATAPVAKDNWHCDYFMVTFTGNHATAGVHMSQQHCGV